MLENNIVISLAVSAEDLYIIHYFLHPICLNRVTNLVWVIMPPIPLVYIYQGACTELWLLHPWGKCLSCRVFNLPRQLPITGWGRPVMMGSRQYEIHARPRPKCWQAWRLRASVHQCTKTQILCSTQLNGEETRFYADDKINA